MAGANVPGVAALYENVGLAVVLVNDRPGVAALYESIPASSFVHFTVGAVHFRIDDTYGVAGLYENVT